MTAAAALRAQLAGGQLVAAPGVLDPMTAKILEGLGFSCLYLGGNALGTQLCVGQPFVTLTETAEAVARIVQAVGVPLVVDAGAGFGEAAHVHHAVRVLEQAGAAALHIDDQSYPKRAHYHKGQGTLAPVADIVGKLRVALDARRDSALGIWARTDAFRVLRSIEAVAERAAAFAEAGADGLVLLDVGPGEVAAVRAAAPGLPLVYIGGIREPVPTAAELGAAGFAVALYPFNTVAAVATAVKDAWSGFATSGRPAQPVRPTAAVVAEMLELVGMPDYWAIEQRTAQRSAE